MVATEPNNIRREKANIRRKEKRKRHEEFQRANNKKCKEIQFIDDHDAMLEDPPRIYAILRKCLEQKNGPPITPAVKIEEIEIVTGEPTKKVRIGSELKEGFKGGLVSLLK